ncbi:MAG: (d)CMP kinase [Lachnospiraceae bacterium]|nr:(d)CMP kinase [Lachnospiraceae bacterium]
MSLKIAIDGPAGAGKSTIAKGLAKKLNAIYVDTGAMYRAIGLYVLRNGIDKNDETAVVEAVSTINVSIVFEDGQQVVLLNGENVNGFIRTEEVGMMASGISGYAKVREKMVNLQRELAESTDVVMDGRDIGTVVLPNANPKIYLTASARVRAERRAAELEAKGEPADIDTIEKDIIDRDYADMHRAVSPLMKAEDAVEIDSSYMTIEEVQQAIIDLCK